MNKTLKYLIIIIGIFLFISMPVTVPLFKSSTPYSMFNTDWDGLSSFVKLSYDKGKTVVPIFDSFDVEGIGDKSGVLLIVAPNTTFTSAEIAEIKTFLERGNTVFIADDFGTGTDVLRALNVPMGISKYPLQDFFYETDDRLIVTVRIKDPLLGRNVTEVVTNLPSAIIVTKEGEAYVSRVAMVNFHRRMFPLMTEMEYGKGRLVVLADPDILANMQFEANRQFIENLIDYLGGDTFYFDEAHHPDFNLYSAGTVTIRRFISKETAINLITAIAIIALMAELGMLGFLGRVISGLLNRFFSPREELGSFISLAKERGWDEKELMEMLNRMGD